MIKVDLYGGLGNQMFQYAAGFALATKLQTDLTINTSAFDNIPVNQTPRNFELDIFDITATITKESASNQSRLASIKRLFSKIIGAKSPIYNEPHYHYDPTFFSHQDGTTLHGYWQSFRYFESYRSLLEREFSFSKSPDERNLNLKNQILNTNSLSIHIRRGDYISNPNSSAHHPVCSVDYYESALRYILDRQEGVQCFVFSDDILWVKENLNLPNSTIFVDHNVGLLAYEDLRLMTSCKHHIIANSSFSWWGAWLGQSEGQIVVSPQIWFRDPAVITSDLIPQNWIRL